MDKTTKGIAIGVAVGIVVAVLLVTVIIPEIEKAKLRHQINQQAELSESIDEVVCHSNMRLLGSLQGMFANYRGGESLAESYTELINREAAEGMTLSTCPDGYRDYEIVVDGEGICTITCPNGHGSITGKQREEPVCSWE